MCILNNSLQFYFKKYSARSFQTQNRLFQSQLHSLLSLSTLKVSLSGWRTQVVWEESRALRSTGEVFSARLVPLKHLFLLIYDLPFVLGFILLTVTLWRAYPTWTALGRVLDQVLHNNHATMMQHSSGAHNGVSQSEDTKGDFERSNDGRRDQGEAQPSKKSDLLRRWRDYSNLRWDAKGEVLRKWRNEVSWQVNFF